MGLFFLKKRKKNLLEKAQKENILKYYEKVENLSEDKLEVINYLRNNDLHAFPYSYKDSYDKNTIEVFWDKEAGLSYVMQGGHKFYFPKRKKRKVQKYLNGLYIEQDLKSPHRYLTKEYSVQKGDVVVDIGAAEGVFALDVVEQAKEIYLFETDPQWIKALEYTFKPWKDKVHIICKFVSDKNDADNVSLDQFFKDKMVNFIKIDVEGAEKSVLEGAKGILMNQTGIKVAVCAYHKQNDAVELSAYLKGFGFNYSLSDGYMIFNPDEAPYLRKGVIRAWK